jgi:hypothetical protein
VQTLSRFRGSSVARLCPSLSEGDAFRNYLRPQGREARSSPKI